MYRGNSHCVCQTPRVPHVKHRISLHFTIESTVGFHSFLQEYLQSFRYSLTHFDEDVLNVSSNSCHPWQTIPRMPGLHQKHELGVLDDCKGPPFLCDPLHNLNPVVK